MPVFVFGRNAYATGIGDRLRPIRLPRRWFVLVMPPVSVATEGVFKDPKLTRNTKPITILGFSEQAPALGGRNDLQPVVLARQPAVKAALDAALAKETCRKRPAGHAGERADDRIGRLRVRRDGKFGTWRRRPRCGFCVTMSAQSMSLRDWQDIHWGVAKLVKAPDFDSGIRRFESFLPSH